MLTFSNQLKESYKVPLIIFIASIGFYVTSILVQPLDLSIISRVSVVVTPLIIAVSSVLVSRYYGNSKIFGKSYLLLGIGHFFAFAGELIYFHYVDSLGLKSYEILGDVLIFSTYFFMMAHIILNIRYFVEKLEIYQKLLLVVIPVTVILVYSLVLMNSQLENFNDFYYYLAFVSASSVVLGMATVGFTLFRTTALTSAWFVLLLGITIGTFGDLFYNYAVTLGVYSFSDFSNVLWFTSPLIMVYALYKHQKSI